MVNGQQSKRAYLNATIFVHSVISTSAQRVDLHVAPTQFLVRQSQD